MERERLAAPMGSSMGPPRTPHVPRVVGASGAMLRACDVPLPVGAWGPLVEARVRRCVSIWSITDDCVMNATMRITPWQDGHARGIDFEDLLRNAAQRRAGSA